MSWGFIPPWAKDPFDKKIPRPFNARSETLEKKLFSGSWKHKRCYQQVVLKNILFVWKIMRLLVRRNMSKWTALMGLN